MYYNARFLLAIIIVSLVSCTQAPKEPEFWLGADIGWCTEYESKGYKFYNKDGQERE